MSVLVPLTVAVPLATAAAIAAFGKLVRSRLVDLAAILAAAAVTAFDGYLLSATAQHSLTYWFGGRSPVHGTPIGIDFVVEPFGASLALLAGVVTLTTLVFSYRYFEEVGALFHVLVLVFLAAMTGFALTGDLFNLFVFFELMSVSAFALTAYRSDEAAPLQGAINFTATNSVAAIVIVFGIGLLYGRTGTLNLAHAGEVLRAQGSPDVLVAVSFALITAGYLTKAAVVPFHFWLADAYAVAPAPACVLFSAVMSDLGLYAVAKVYWSVFAGPFGAHAATVRHLFLALGVVTALVGAVMAFLQRHLKRLLAFATISHIGLFLLGIGMLTATGIAGAALYIFTDGLIKGGLFLAAGTLAHVRDGGDELRLRGQGRGLWLVGATMALGGLGLAAVPPLGTFAGKSLIESGASELGLGWLPWVMLAAELVTGAAVLRATGRIFLGLGPAHDALLSRQDEEAEEQEPEGPRRSPVVMALPALFLVVGGLALGLVPGVGAAAETAGRRFVAHPHPAGSLVAHAPPTELLAVLLGVASTLGALGLAALALTRRERLAGGRDRLLRAVQPVADAARAVHSGHVGDYVTFFTVGTALIGAVSALWLR